MPIYTIETPLGKRLKIESDDPEEAVRLADQWADDTDAVVRTTWGEARSDPDSQAGVASVILNRAKATGQSPRDVVTAKGQFEPWGNPETRARLEGLDPQSPEYQDILNRISPALGGEDATNGATHFYAPKAQAALGRKPPAWDDGSGVDMGQHRFFSRPGDFGAAPPEVTAEIEGRPDLGAGVAHATPTKAPLPGQLPQKAAPPANIPDPTIAQDVWSGLSQPFKALGHDVAENYRRVTAQGAAGAPRSFGEAAEQSLADLTALPRLAGDTLGLLAAPIQAIVRPTARGLNRLPMRPYTQDTPFSAPRATYGEEAQGIIEGGINNALSGARPKSTRAAAGKPQTLEQLKAADEAAWARVDASGYRFPKKEAVKMAADVRKLVNDAGPELYPDANRIANRIEDLASRGQLTPAQANRLRSQVGEKLLSPGSTEGSVGRDIKARIDQMIDGAANASAELKAARQSYTQYVKMREVSDRLDDAAVNRATSGTGGNSNSPRQALKPLIKKQSTQRIRNFTPEEQAAANRAVKGGPAQNLLRAGSAFDPFHGRLGMLLQGGLGIKTGGLSAVTIPFGMAATAGEKALGARNVQKLLDVISMGGSNPANALPIISRLPVLSPAGATGAGVIAAPLARIPPERAAPRTASSAKSKTRR